MADDKHQAESPAQQRTVVSQVDKFRNLARELGADEDEARFEATVKKVAKVPPAEAAKPKSD